MLTTHGLVGNRQSALDDRIFNVAVAEVKRAGRHTACRMIAGGN